MPAYVTEVVWALAAHRHGPLIIKLGNRNGVVVIILVVAHAEAYLVDDVVHIHELHATRIEYRLPRRITSSVP